MSAVPLYLCHPPIQAEPPTPRSWAGRARNLLSLSRLSSSPLSLASLSRSLSLSLSRSLAGSRPRATFRWRVTPFLGETITCCLPQARETITCCLPQARAPALLSAGGAAHPQGCPRPRGANTLQPYTLHPTPYTLYPAPYTLHPSPYTLHPTPYTLHPAPYNPHPRPLTLDSGPWILARPQEATQGPSWGCFRCQFHKKPGTIVDKWLQKRTLSRTLKDVRAIEVQN